MKIHFICEKVVKGELRVLHVPSEYQLVLFDEFCDNIKLQPLETNSDISSHYIICIYYVYHVVVFTCTFQSIFIKKI